MRTHATDPCPPKHFQPPFYFSQSTGISVGKQWRMPKGWGALDFEQQVHLLWAKQQWDALQVYYRELVQLNTLRISKDVRNKVALNPQLIPHILLGLTSGLNWSDIQFFILVPYAERTLEYQISKARLERATHCYIEWVPSPQTLRKMEHQHRKLAVNRGRRSRLTHGLLQLG